MTKPNGLIYIYIPKQLARPTLRFRDGYATILGNIIHILNLNSLRGGEGIRIAEM